MLYPRRITAFVNVAIEVAVTLPATFLTIRNCIVPIKEVIGRVPDDALVY